MITPEQMAKADTEHAHQSAIFCWAALPEQKLVYPCLQLMFAIPNGGHRDKRTAAKLQAEGVKAGVLDIFLPVPIGHYHGLFIEMKKKPNKPSDEQNKFANAVSEQGYCIALCYNWEQARDTIIKYLAGEL